MFDKLSEAEAVDAITEVGLRPVKSSYDEAHRMVEEREAVTALFSAGWCLAALGDAPDIKARYDAVKRIEKILQRGHQMGYSTDKEARIRVDSGEYAAGLMTPTATKREVVETALAGRVFAQKTTRHIIPARPMNVNVPISWLRGDLRHRGSQQAPPRAPRREEAREAATGADHRQALRRRAIHFPVGFFNCLFPD